MSIPASGPCEGRMQVTNRTLIVATNRHGREDLAPGRADHPISVSCERLPAARIGAGESSIAAAIGITCPDLRRFAARSLQRPGRSHLRVFGRGQDGARALRQSLHSAHGPWSVLPQARCRAAPACWSTRNAQRPPKPRSRCRVMRSSRRASAASSRSAPSGDRCEARAASTTSACGTRLRAA
jgi:hypothetical protein